MAEVTIAADEFPALWHCKRGSEEFDEHLSAHEAITWIKQGWQMSLYVKGWKEPWKCFVEGPVRLRARCPTAPKVIPLVREEEPNG